MPVRRKVGLALGKRLISSTDPFDLLRALHYRGGAAVDLVDTLKSDKRGDFLALARAGLNLVQPGSGDHLAELKSDVSRAAAKFMGGLTDAVIEEGDVWSDFLRHYQALPFGVVCIVGDPGFGKTTFAVKSASIWHERTGWPVDLVNFYPGDEPPFGQRIPGDRVIARIRKVGQFLNQQDLAIDIDDGLTLDDLRPRGKPKVPPRLVSLSEIEAMSCRYVIIDEAALFFSNLGASGQQDSREAAKRFSDQIRHLKTILICIAQKISDLPPHIRASAIMVYKWASEDTIRLDFKQGSKHDSQERWSEALSALQAVKTGAYVEPFPNWMTEKSREAIRNAALAHEYYKGDLADIVAWAYVVAPGLGGHGTRCVVPVTPYAPMVELDDGEESDMLTAEVD